MWKPHILEVDECNEASKGNCISNSNITLTILANSYKALIGTDVV